MKYEETVKLEIVCEWSKVASDVLQVFQCVTTFLFSTCLHACFVNKQHQRPSRQEKLELPLKFIQRKKTKKVRKIHEILAYTERTT